MKKLMVALSAAALAFGVRADVEFPVGENFNDATEPSMITSRGESSISENEYSFSQVSTVGLPNQWALGTDAGKNLAVKTSLSDPAYYAIGEAQSMPASGQAVTPLYFDSLVKFTYCDEDATVPTGSDAKLMVWVREDETAGTTNLMVTAGFYKAGVVQPEVKHYNCGPLAGYGVTGADDWCRLTIKAKGDITSAGQIPGFVVCVNGAPVTIAALPEGNRDIGEAGSATATLNAVDSFWHAENHLFPSMNADDTISAVGFAGQGAVDDISFAKAEPTLAVGATTFCVDKAVASITWPTDGSLTEVTVGGKTMTLSDGAISVPAGEVVAVTATAAEGWMITGGTGSVTPVEGTPSEITTAKIGVTIGDEKFATFADAIAYINGTTAEGALTVSFASDFTPEAFATTITPGENVESLTIDLAGKTLTYEGEEGYAISSAVPLTITDSSEDKDGMITATYGDDIDGIVQITEEVAFTVDAGIIDGFVESSVDYNIITGGSFKNDDGAGFYLWDNDTTKTYGDKTYEAKHDGTYWTVAEKAYAGPEIVGGAYQITDARDLFWVATNKACHAEKFEQTADIVWTSADGVDGTFPGIGTYKSNAASGDDFSGTYDGQGHSIKDIVLKGSSDSNNGKYAGLFNQVKGGTVQNLVVDGVTFADTWDYTKKSTAADADFNKEIGGAMAIAHLMDGTVKNVTTKGSFGTADKPLTASAGGVVCRVSGGALIEACTNEASLYGAGAKVAGILILAQNGKDNTTVTIKDCYNSGSINFVNKGRSDTAGGYGGIAAYLGNGKANQYIQNCVNVGEINASAQTGGAIGSILGSQRTDTGTVTATGCSAQADMLGVGYKASTCTGLTYATVTGGVATFVEDSALVAGRTYKVMAAGAKPTIALAKDESIAFDQTLATIDATGITAPNGYAIVPTGTGTITYAPAIQTYNITYVYKTNSVEIAAEDIAELANSNPKSYTVENAITISAANITAKDFDVTSVDNDGWTAGEKTGDVTVTVTLTAKAGPTPIDPDPTKPTEIEAQDKDAAEAKAATMDVNGMPTVEGLDQTKWNAYFDKTVSEGKDATHWNVTATLKPEIVKAETETTAVAAKLNDIAAAESGAVDVSITGAKPGLWYSLYEGAKLDNTRAEGDRTMAGADGAVTLKATHYDGSGFYQIKVNVANKQ